jgi:hypothetical protein
MFFGDIKITGRIGGSGLVLLQKFYFIATTPSWSFYLDLWILGPDITSRKFLIHFQGVGVGHAAPGGIDPRC